MLYGHLDTLREDASAQLQGALLQTGGTPADRSHRDSATALYTDQHRPVQRRRERAVLRPARLRPATGSDESATSAGSASSTRTTTTSRCCIDWRAPAARPFYLATAAVAGRGAPAPAHRAPGGRTVTGIDDEVLDLDAARATGPAARRPDRRGGAARRADRQPHRPDAATSSRPSRPSRTGSSGPTSTGVLVVQGGPGTGKTAVALHRAAYLLYTHRQQLSPRGVLIVGPNPTFLRYISQVLPSLAETGVLLATLGDLFPGVTRPPDEPPPTAEIKGRAGWPTCWPPRSRDRQRVPDEAVEIDLDGDALRARPRTVHRGRRDRGPAAPASRTTWPGRSSSPRSSTRCRCRSPTRSAPTRTPTTRSAATTPPATRSCSTRPTSPRSAASCAATPRSRRRWTGCGRSSPRSSCCADLFADPDRLAAAAPALTERSAPCCCAARRRLDPGRRAAARRGWPNSSARTTRSRGSRAERQRAAADRLRRGRPGDRRRVPLARRRGRGRPGDAARHRPARRRAGSPNGTRTSERLTAGRTRRRRPHVGVRPRHRRRGAGAVADGVAAADAPLPEPVDDRRRRRRPDRRPRPAPRPGRRCSTRTSPSRWRLAELTVNYRTPAEIMAVAADVLAGDRPRPGAAPVGAGGRRRPVRSAASHRPGCPTPSPRPPSRRPPRPATAGSASSSRPARFADLVPAVLEVLPDAAVGDEPDSPRRSWCSPSAGQGPGVRRRHRRRPGPHRGRVTPRRQRPLRRPDPGHPAPRRPAPRHPPGLAACRRRHVTLTGDFRRARRTARRILDLLLEGPQPVGELTARTGLTQPGTSKHLRVLREAGLVTVRQDAQRRWYELVPEPLAELDAWLIALPAAVDGAPRRARTCPGRTAGDTRLLGGSVMGRTPARSPNRRRPGMPSPVPTCP